MTQDCQRLRLMKGCQIMHAKLKAIALAFIASSGMYSALCPQAKADIMCYPWEKNCVEDGRIGTSGNDIFGNSGGDTIQKGAAVLDNMFSTGGMIQGGVNQIYEPNKRRVLDCVGSAIAPSMPGFMQGSIDTTRCQNQGPVTNMPGGPATPLPRQSGRGEMGGWQSPDNSNGGRIESVPSTNMPAMSGMGGMYGMPGMGGAPGMGGMYGMPGMGGAPGMGGMYGMPGMGGNY